MKFKPGIQPLLLPSPINSPPSSNLSSADAKAYQTRFAGLDLAIDSLHPHTDFHKMGHKLYYRSIEGAITLKQEEKLRELGVKL